MNVTETNNAKPDRAAQDVAEPISPDVIAGKDAPRPVKPGGGKGKGNGGPGNKLSVEERAERRRALNAKKANKANVGRGVGAGQEASVDAQVSETGGASSDGTKQGRTPGAGKGQRASVPARVDADRAVGSGEVIVPAKPQPPSKNLKTSAQTIDFGPKPVPPARVQRRHRFVIVTFFLMVLLPIASVIYYLTYHAQDRYASNAAFFVHREDVTPSVETVFGVPGLGGQGSTPDADILYQFIQSQRMVELADAALDLRSMYSPSYEIDPVFALDPNATLEDLVDYWGWIVSMVFSPDTGLITLEVVAFEPAHAKALAEVILAESASLIDDLSQIARTDTISQAQGDLDLAEMRLREARVAVAEFRNSSQFVDPTAVVAGSEGVITALEQRLATEMINRDTLIGTTTREDDPRIDRADRVIEAIRDRIAEERATVGNDQAAAVGAYEELLVDRQFAEQAYTAALAAYNAAVAEAGRKSRYLAAHITPSLAASPVYPQRVILTLLAVGLFFMVWFLMVLILYSIRDRR